MLPRLVCSNSIIMLYIESKVYLATTYFGDVKLVSLVVNN